MNQEKDRDWPFNSYNVDSFLQKLSDYEAEHFNGLVTPGLSSVLDKVDRVIRGDLYRKSLEQALYSTDDYKRTVVVDTLTEEHVRSECRKWNSKLKWVSPHQEMISIQNRIETEKRNLMKLLVEGPLNNKPIPELEELPKHLVTNTIHSDWVEDYIYPEGDDFLTYPEET